MPENFNILNVSLIDCSKNGKALDDLQIKVYGPLNSSSILKNKLYNRCQIYIENSSVIMLEFYEQKEPIDTLEPTHSRSLSINSRNWSSDRSCI